MVFIGATLVTAGIFSCSNDEVNKSPLENTEQKSNLQHKDDGPIEIGKITGREDDAEFTIDIEKFKTEILKYDLLAEIESVEIDATYLTIIGKDKEDFSLISFQAELLKDGAVLYFPNIENVPIETFSTHTCRGNNCSSCAFIKDAKNKITGCECKTGRGQCNHTISEGEDTLIDKIKKWVDMVIKAFKIVKSF